MPRIKHVTRNAREQQQRRRNEGRRREPLPPMQLPWGIQNLEHQDKFNLISRRKIGDTRFIDEITLNILEIKNTVLEYLDNIGWRRFATLNVPTYRELVYEFLSSLSFTIYPFDTNTPQFVEFTLLGVRRKISLTEFNGIFGFQNEGVKKEPREFNANNLWAELTGIFQFVPSEGKANLIRDHAIRYIHRFMSHTLFGRGENNSKISKQELFFIWCMIERRQVNTGFWLLHQFKHLGNPIRGKIVGAGIITAIAYHFGFSNQDYNFAPVGGIETVDLALCKKMGLCILGEDNVYYLIDRDGNRVQRDAPMPEGVPIDTAPVESDTDDETDTEAAHIRQPPPAYQASTSSSTVRTIEDQLRHMEIENERRYQQLREENEMRYQTLQQLIESGFQGLRDDFDARFQRLEDRYNFQGPHGPS